MPTSKQISKAAAFTDPNAFATTMVVVLIDAFGTEALNWHPATIRLETEEAFGFKWDATNFDRLMAGIAIVITDSFYRSLPDFIELCSILSGGDATPGEFSPVDALECAWGITEALLLSPPGRDEDKPFSEEICAFIGKITEMEGIVTLPDILRIGTRDEDLVSKVRDTYSDDPELFASIFEVEAERTNEINEIIKARLQQLMQQLASLQLTNGSTMQLAKRVAGGLAATESTSVLS